MGYLVLLLVLISLGFLFGWCWKAEDAREKADKIIYIIKNSTNENLIKNTIIADLNKKIINTIGTNGNTALIAAIKKKDIGLVKLLLANGADVNVTDGTNTSALSWAIYGNNIQAIKELLFRDARVRNSDIRRIKNGETKEEIISLLYANNKNKKQINDLENLLERIQKLDEIYEANKRIPG